MGVPAALGLNQLPCLRLESRGTAKVLSKGTGFKDRRSEDGAAGKQWPSRLGRATEEQVGPSSSGVGDLTGRRATTGRVVWVCVSDAAGRGQCKVGAATASVGRREAARRPVNPVLGAPTGHQLPARRPGCGPAVCPPGPHPTQPERSTSESQRPPGPPVSPPPGLFLSHTSSCVLCPGVLSFTSFFNHERVIAAP